VHQLGRWLQKLCSLQFRVQDSNQSHQRAQPRVSLPSQVYQVPHQVICYQLTFVRKPLIVFRNVELLYFLTGSEPNFGKISYNCVTFNTKSSHYDLKNISLGSWIWDPGSGINPFRIPDPGVKKAPDPEFRSPNTACGSWFYIIFLTPGSAIRNVLLAVQ
jgi:hypothetical protein